MCFLAGAAPLMSIASASKPGVNWQYMSEAGAVAARIISCGPGPGNRRHAPGNAAGQSELAPNAHASTFEPTSPEPAASRAPREGENGTEPASPARHVQDGGWFYDYSNGGPRFDEEDASQDEIGGPSGACKVLAQYHDLANAAAAVLCPVGKGQAVLCGTHPELAPHWLGAADSPLNAMAPQELKCVGNASNVKERLQRTWARRLLFWAELLIACGLKGHLA